MPKKFRRFIGKSDTLANESPKRTRRRMYAGRIKATKGLQNVTDPLVKAISHRIVRRKLQREMLKKL